MLHHVTHRGVVHHQIPGGAEGICVGQRADNRGRRWSAGAFRSWGRWSRTPKSSFAPFRDPLSYGVLRYLNADVDLDGSDPPIGFNYFGRLGAPGADAAGAMADGWWISQDGLSLIGAATAVPMPLMHTLDVNAGTIDSPAPGRSCMS